MDLGDNHTLKFYGWAPDRALNPQYKDIPDVEKYGAFIEHLTPDGQKCEGAVAFDGPVQRQLGEKVLWVVECWEPLTISPSVLCGRCNDHGFIRQGKWVKA